MVNTENLLFIKGSQEFFVKLAGSCQVCSERFFDNQTFKSFAIYDVFRLEMFGNGTEKLRSHGQEEEFIVLSLVLLIESVLKLAQLNVVLGILHIMTLIVEVTGKLLGLLWTVS